MQQRLLERGAAVAVKEPEETEYTTVYHHYTPHRAGLPRLIPYFRELWHRRFFAAEMSRAELRSANSNTFFGAIWMVLNPLLLSGVYFILVTILRQVADFHVFTHLTLNIFVFTFVSHSITGGSKSVVKAGKLLTNTAFPRLLMPLSTVRTGFFKFLPTIPVYLVFHIIGRHVWSPTMLLSLYFLLTMVVFSMGMAAFFATLQVYFRDTASFLPYFVRMAMYLSPILWMPEDVTEKLGSLATLAYLNPMYSMLTGYTQTIQDGIVPELHIWIISGAVAAGVAVIGFLYFISREREFAVRLV